MEDSLLIDDGELKGGSGLTEIAKEYLTETAKWAKFLSILGFVGIGFMILAAIIVGVALGNMPGMSGSDMPFPPALLSLIYIAMAALYFFPILYLYRFADKMGKGIKSGNNQLITEGFENMKSHYKFLGIMTLVMISLYVVIIIIAVFAGVMAS